MKRVFCEVFVMSFELDKAPRTKCFRAILKSMDIFIAIIGLLIGG